MTIQDLFEISNHKLCLFCSLPLINNNIDIWAYCDSCQVYFLNKDNKYLMISDKTIITTYCSDPSMKNIIVVSDLNTNSKSIDIKISISKFKFTTAEIYFSKIKKYIILA